MKNDFKVGDWVRRAGTGNEGIIVSQYEANPRDYFPTRNPPKRWITPQLFDAVFKDRVIRGLQKRIVDNHYFGIEPSDETKRKVIKASFTQTE